MVVLRKILDRIKRLLKRKKKKEPAVIKINKAKARKIKITARDIQENCVRIKYAMDHTPINTPEYDALAKELDYQIGLLKKVKDANQVISVKDFMVIGGTSAALIFFIALAREYPSAVKMASMILKFVPFKG
jgi:hypothetical protein